MLYFYSWNLVEIHWKRPISYEILYVCRTISNKILKIYSNWYQLKESEEGVSHIDIKKIIIYLHRKRSRLRTYLPGQLISTHFGGDLGEAHWPTKPTTQPVANHYRVLHRSSQVLCQQLSGGSGGGAHWSTKWSHHHQTAVHGRNRARAHASADVFDDRSKRFFFRSVCVSFPLDEQQRGVY